MVLKIMKRMVITVAAVSFIAMALPTMSFAQEGQGGYGGDYYSDGGVNSGFWGLILQAGYGFGQTSYGYVIGSTTDSTLGVGPGGGFDLGVMLNLSIFAVKLNYTRASLDTLKWTLQGHDYETNGDGNYSTLDLLLGLKLFTEEEDMGYTHLYAGYRYWGVERNVDEELIDSITTGTTYKHEVTGGGWIVGFHDLSTLPLGIFSLAFNSALWIDSAPFSSFKVDGAESNLETLSAFGIGLDVGVGVAFEEMGFLILAGYRMDVTVTKFRLIGDDNILGAGYSLAYLSIAKEF